MGFAHLVNFDNAIEGFKVTFGIPEDIHIKYCPEGDIENDRRLGLIFLL